MKKLNRDGIPPPNCLSKFDHSKHDWDKVKPKHKKAIWQQLMLMQNDFCVYCELPTSLGQGRGHIEHFYHKGAKDSNGVRYNAHLTFSWDNLFNCCDHYDHCGHYKDQPQPGNIPRQYDQNQLIKPDVDNPEMFLYFLRSGEVEPKSIEDGQICNRAIETIKTLNLSNSSLKNSRAGVISHFSRRLQALNQLFKNQEINKDKYDDMYDDIESEAALSKHRTAIKQVLF